MEINKKRKLISVVLALFYVALALGFVVAGTWLSDLVRKKENVSNPPPIVTCPKDIDSYKALQEKKQVVHFFEQPVKSYAVNGSFDQPNGFKTIITKVNTDTSKVVCGYLYVRAHTSEGPLASYQNFYIKPDKYGGHINKVGKFAGLGDVNDFSEYYFSLDNITYWKDKNRGEVLNADWASLFNVSSSVEFKVALNVHEDYNATIDDIAIAYKCKDPVTGEENKGCSLSIDTTSEKVNIE